MKLIKRGDTWRQVTCFRCESEVEIEDTDIVVFWRNEHNSSYTFSITCMVCRGDLKPPVPTYILEKLHQINERHAEADRHLPQ